MTRLPPGQSSSLLSPQANAQYIGAKELLNEFHAGEGAFVFRTAARPCGKALLKLCVLGGGGIMSKTICDMLQRWQRGRGVC